MEVTKIQDDDGHWYWIPNRFLVEFKNDLTFLSGKEYMDDPDSFDQFTDKYEKYRTLGDPNLMPAFFKPVQMDKTKTRYFYVCSQGQSISGFHINTFDVQTTYGHPTLKRLKELALEKFPDVKQPVIVSISELSEDDWKRFVSEQ